MMIVLRAAGQKGDWQVSSTNMPKFRTVQLYVHLACQRLGLCAVIN